MSSTDHGPARELSVVVDDRESIEEVLDRLWLAAGRAVRLAIPPGTSLFLTASEFRLLKEVATRREVDLTIETEDPLRVQLAGLFGLAAVRVGGPLGPRRLPDPKEAEWAAPSSPRLVAAPASRNGHSGSPAESGPLPGIPVSSDAPPGTGEVATHGDHASVARRPDPANDGPRFREPGQPFTVRSIEDRPAPEIPGRAPGPAPQPTPARPVPVPVVAPATAVAANGAWTVPSPPVEVSSPVGRRFEDLRAAAERRAVREARGWNRRLAALVAGGAGLIVVLAAFAVFVVLPKATVTLDLKAQTIVSEVPFRVVPPGEAAEPGARAVPGQPAVVEVSYTASTETTGVVGVGETPARGTLQLVNPTDDPVTIPAGTIGTGDAGTRFRVVDEVTVPAADGASGQAEAAVEVVEPGTVGNLGVGELSGVLDSGVYFSNRTTPLAGGADREGRGVAQADIDGLTDRFNGELAALAAARFAETLPAGEAVVEGSLSFDEPTMVFDRAVGDLGDSVTLTATVQVQGLTYRIDEVMAAAEPILSEDLRARVPAGYDLDPETIAFSPPVGSAEANDEGATVVVTASGRAIHRFAEEERSALVERLAGTSADDAAEILRALPAVDAFSVDYFPGLVGERMPRRTDRIEIVIRD